MRTLTRESTMAKFSLDDSHIERLHAARELWRRFSRRQSAMIGLVLLLMIFAASIFAPLIVPFDPEKQKLSQALIAPGGQFLLGTDHLGRDMLTRLLYGARLSLTIGFLAVAFGLAVGLPLGSISGYYGKWVDLVIQRFADILLSFPSFLLALSLVAMLGVGLQNVIISVGVSAVPSFIRLVRGSVLTIREDRKSVV